MFSLIGSAGAPVELLIFVMASVFFGGIGYLIGKGKGRGVAGFWLGLHTVRWWSAPVGGSLLAECTSTSSPCVSSSLSLYLPMYYVDMVATKVAGDGVPTSRLQFMEG
jgi:hypothetical protein